MSNMNRVGKPIVFMFPGQGSQYYQMGKELYQKNDRFRYWVDDLDRIVIRKAGFSVVETVFHERKARSLPFTDLSLSHPAIVVVELALAKVLVEYGIRPDYLVGSSLGEFTAVALAEGMDIETLFDLIIHQGSRLSCTSGNYGMTAVMMPKEQLLPIISDHNCDIAGENSQTHFVIAGPKSGLEKCAGVFQQRDVSFQPLLINQAFHSRYLDGFENDIAPYITKQTYRSLQIPLFSCATATVIKDLAKDHFWRVIREPIRFVDTMALLGSDRPAIYVDIGPSSTLTNFLKINTSDRSKSEFYSIMDPFGSDLHRFEVLVDKYGDKNMSSNQSDLELGSLKGQVLVFPGQGSQQVGMGAQLFSEFPELVKEADEILGYSIEQLCLHDPDKKLSKTEFTQPALYVVESLSYLMRKREKLSIKAVAGHSLGEYTALFASGAFDFSTGLRLVKKRGELMSAAKVDGGMAAVLNVDADKIESLLVKSKLAEIDIANFNKPDQIVIAGPKDKLKLAERIITRVGGTFIPLNVSAPFHSRYMESAAKQFEQFLDEFEFGDLDIPVISNVTARPYQRSEIKVVLAKQICSPVRWSESVRYLMGMGDLDFIEVGPGDVLSKLAANIIKNCEPIVTDSPAGQESSVVVKEAGQTANLMGVRRGDSEKQEPRLSIIGNDMGFSRYFSCASNYLIGAMDGSVSYMSAARASGLLSYITLPRSDIDSARSLIGEASKNGLGVRFQANFLVPEDEIIIADALIEGHICHIEAEGFFRPTKALVKLRIKSASANSSSRLLIRASSLEAAKKFMRPADQELVNQLVRDEQITAEEVSIAKELPLADAIAYSGEWQQLQQLIQARDDQIGRGKPFVDGRRVFIGSAYGIGSPSTVISAVTCGAEFVIADSIYLCTRESGVKSEIKSLLQVLNEADIAMAPHPDLFEFGQQVPVVDRNGSYVSYAKALLRIWKSEESVDKLSSYSLSVLEAYALGELHEIWTNIVKEPNRFSLREVEDAAQHPRLKLSLIIKYLLMEKSISDGIPLGIGKELGEFNRWLNKKGVIEWQDRKLIDIASKVIDESSRAA